MPSPHAARDDLRRANDPKMTIKRLMGYLLPYIPLLILVVLMTFASSAFSVLQPSVTGGVTTALFEGATQGTFDWNRITTLLLTLAGIYVGSQVLGALQGIIMTRMTTKVLQGIRDEIDQKVHRLPLDYYDSRNSGEILSIITNDVDMVDGAISRNLTQLVSQLVMVVGKVFIIEDDESLRRELATVLELDGGSIVVDGVGSQQMTRNELRRRFGMVLQDTWLFQGTVFENLAYGREGATEEDVVRAAKVACVDPIIRPMPVGYDMMLTSGAENVSQGERQLLTIARALVADPEIMILDEATSNVDARTEQLIQEAMAQLLVGRTSFVIAHRLSTIRDADKILYMEHGDILETGTHDQLMALDGRYAALYSSQYA